MDDGAGGCWRLQMRVDGGRATQKGAHPEIQAAEGAAMRIAGKGKGDVRQALSEARVLRSKLFRSTRPVLMRWLIAVMPFASTGKNKTWTSDTFGYA